MKKLRLTVFAVICAFCIAFGAGLMMNVNIAKADAGTTPTLSETKVKLSTDKTKMLLATAIKGYGDVYEVGYTFNGEVTPSQSQSKKFYTSISDGVNTPLTPSDIFDEDWADDDGVGMIIWEIPFSVGAEYEYKAYALVGDRNAQDELIEPDEEVRVTPNDYTAKQFYTVTIAANNGEYGSVSKSEVVVPSGSAIAVNDNVVTVGGIAVTATATDATAEWTYSFDEFEYEGNTVTGNKTITANFTRTNTLYTVTVVSNNGDYGTVDVASVTSVPYGTVITTSTNTVNINGTVVTATETADTAQYDYSFTGWTNGTATVEGAITVTANFTRELNEYAVTWIDDSGAKSDKVEQYDYGTVPTFPYAYFESRGNGTYIYSMTVKTSTDGGSTFTADASSFEGDYGASTIRPWGADLSDFNAGLTAVTGDVLYKVIYNEENPVTAVSGGVGFAVAQTPDELEFTFSNIKTDNTANTFRIHGDLNIYQFEQGNQYLAIKIDAIGDASAALTVNGVSGTGSVILPAYYMDNFDAAADHFAVDVKIDGGTATGFTATLAFVDGTAADITTVVNNYNTNFGSFTGVNLENFRSTTTKISSFETAYSSAAWTSKSILSAGGYADKVANIKDSYIIVDNMQGADVASRFTTTVINSFNNGTTSPGVASTLNHPVYGPCATLGKTDSGKSTIVWNNPEGIDLSGYDRVLVGIRNGHASQAMNICSTPANDAPALYTGIPANMSTTGTFVTLVMTVDEFLNGFATWQGQNSSFWLTTIIAIKGSLTNSSYYTMYESELSADGVTAADIKVVDDMRGTDIKTKGERFNWNGGVNGLNNGDTAPNVASSLIDANYKQVSTAGLSTGMTSIFKLSDKAKANIDLTEYDYIYVAIKSSSAGTISVKNDLETVTYASNVEQGTWVVVKMTVQQFLDGGIAITKTTAGSVWFAPIIAAKVA